MRGMSPGIGANKRLGVGGGGGFALGCGCKDAKAVAVAVMAASASPYSATVTETATANSATWRRARAAQASGSTGTLTAPSASSSSFLWENAVEAAGEEEEVNCKRESSATTTPSFSGLLRQLNELEQSVVSWGRKSTSKSYFSRPPPPPPLPPRPVKHRVVRSGDTRDSKEGHGSFSPPPPPPLPYFQFQTKQHWKAKSMDKGDRQEEEVHYMQPPPPPYPLPSEHPRNMKSTDKLVNKKDVDNFPPPQAPKHRKAKSCDGGTGRIDGSVAVVKESDDPLSDFRRSMMNMIVENKILTGDELRKLLRHFLALNAPHHHDAILRAFTEIWDEAFTTKAPHRKAARPTPPRQRAPPPPRRRNPPRAWH
ncbi:transcription repressor OFP1-like [Phragmites australis]|uniref:transcription repressor OFP1-like n=1 Tax=Phragmites australis TaxID=29695 RepID=UPI002D775DCF|nr:transcription repressor OFP1-like [Phragmites australis]